MDRPGRTGGDGGSGGGVAEGGQSRLVGIPAPRLDGQERDCGRSGDGRGRIRIKIKIRIKIRIWSDPEAHGEDFRLEAASAAGVAVLRVHKALEPVAGEFAFALGVKAFEIGNDALERTAHFAGVAGAPEGELDVFIAGAVEELLFKIAGQVLPGSGQALAELGGQAT